MRPVGEQRARGRRRTACPSTTPCTPRPSRLAKSVDRGQRADPLAARRRRSPGRSGARRRPRARRPAAAPRRRRSPSAGDDVDQGHPAGGDGAGLVQHDGVDPAGGLQHLGALDQDAELGAAAGADQQRGRRGQAEGARAGDDQHGDRGGERGGRAARRRRARTPSVATASAITTGTKTAGDPVGQPLHLRPCRSGPPRPAGPSGRAGCRRRPGWPGPRSRPPALTVAPVTASPGADLDRHRLAGEHARRRPPRCPRRPRRRWRSSRRAGRRTGRRPPARSTGIRASTPSRSTATSLAPELEQRPQRGAGAALGPRLEVAAGQDERGDAGGDLEVDVAGAVAARDGRARTDASCPGIAGGAEEQRVQRPAERGERAERDQGVHRRGAVPQVGPGRPVERPARPRRPPARPASATATASCRTAAPGPSPARSTGTRQHDARRCSRVRRRPQLVAGSSSVGSARRPAARAASAV